MTKTQKHLIGKTVRCGVTQPTTNLTGSAWYYWPISWTGKVLDVSDIGIKLETKLGKAWHFKPVTILEVLPE